MKKRDSHEAQRKIMDVDQAVGGKDFKGGDHVKAQKKAKQEENPAGAHPGLEHIDDAPQAENGEPAKQVDNEGQEKVPETEDGHRQRDFPGLAL